MLEPVRHKQMAQSQEKLHKTQEDKLKSSRPGRRAKAICFSFVFAAVQ